MTERAESRVAVEQDGADRFVVSRRLGEHAYAGVVFTRSELQELGAAIDAVFCTVRGQE